MNTEKKEMSSIDIMLAKHIQKSLRVNLGKKQTERIEGELYSWYKMNLEQAMTQFDALDRVLVNIYGRKPASALEKKFVKPIIESNPGKNTPNSITLIINDNDLASEIFGILKDEMCMEIINMLKKEPMTASQIITHKKLQDYSDKTIYRKTNLLYDLGCITVSGHVQSKENKRVRVYMSTFDTVDLKINGTNIAMEITVKKTIARDSLILSTAFS